MHSKQISLFGFILMVTLSCSLPVSDVDVNEDRSKDLDFLIENLQSGEIQKILEFAKNSNELAIDEEQDVNTREFSNDRWVDAPYFLKRDLNTPYFMKRGLSTPYFMKRSVSTPYFIKRHGVSTPYFMKRGVSTPYFMKKSVSTPYFMKREVSQDLFNVLIEKMIADQNYDPFSSLKEQDFKALYKKFNVKEDEPYFKPSGEVSQE